MTPSSIDPCDIELATLAAVPPEAREEIDGWILSYDSGTVGRSHSAAPLRHDDIAPAQIEEISRRYRERGLKAVVRVPRLASFELLRETLEGQGWRASRATSVQVAACARVADAVAAPVEITTHPTASWAEVFLGPGFDPVDGESRLRILGRSTSSVFATVLIDQQAAAVGSACFSHGWCGVHGMRTVPGYRERGLARGILAALAAQAIARGVDRAFLQVEQENTRAQRIYARAGFAPVWTYEYWAEA